MRGDARTIRNALIIVCLGAVMSAVDATVTNVALNTLEHDLHASIASVQWVITAYLLTVAGVIPVSGWASRRFGARQVYVCSLALFGVSSALCALAGSLQMLVACRLLQGVAGGMLVPLGQLIAAEVAGPSRMGKMVSRIWMFSSIGSMLGPTIGGGLVQGLGWRWIFMINVPISLIATVAALYLLPETPSRPAGRLDIGGLVRLSLGVPAMVFALAQAEQTGSLVGPSAALPLLAGILLVADFVRHALRSKRPLLDVRLCARPTFSAGLIAIFFVDIAWFGVLVLLPLAFQQLRHASPLSAGLLMAPQGLGTAVGMWLCGRLGDGPLARRLGAAGALVLVVTTLLIAGVGPRMAAWPICLTLLCAGFGAGLSWVPATAASYVGLKRSEISHGSPLVTVTMRLGASFGTAIAAIMLQAQLRAGATQANDVQAAYRASFHWEAGIALVAALTYVFMCRVVTRTPITAPPETGEFNVVAAELG
ncbi:MAG TPA: MDR family MFS transporter [Solirubrobacteraceae bacterium]|nr:MDR family MFS transporter [Solirubrobacteraceae bacterium]